MAKKRNQRINPDLSFTFVPASSRE